MKEMYPKNGRVILHVDMNSFYASVEMAYDPELKGKPLAIAGNVEERRGIIVTCSYEARKFGVKTTMPLWEAKKLCPQLVVMKPNFERYRAASTAMFEILRQYTELVEPVSIDEGYMDITESFSLGSPIEIAESIQKRILKQLDLPCSIGIAPNKFLAKTASDMKKPLGITIMRKRDIPTVLWPLNTNEMHGVGKKTAEKLQTIGIHTIGDLAKGNEIQLKTLLGINGLRIKERANGIDFRLVDPESVSEFKSIGNSTTLPRDISNQQELFQVLEGLAETVSTRLRRKTVMASALAITIRYKDRKTISKSMKLLNPINHQNDISTFAKQLFLKAWNGDPVRLLGITGNDLVEQDHAYKQLDLFSFEKDAKKEPLLKTLSSLREKYGKNIIERAGSHNNEQAENVGTGTSFNKDFLRSFPEKKKDEH
ncbi:DNA polymerase IV [Bacillus sp. AFS076308]|uniref:DNA polymerase IV n=1 Tax=unclassified Bacillus (in: firmicutes) TaxID=185979 RepID=UPI000BF5399E|nr:MULTISPECIES: DNA polymerase IV [unclassified Bacillus (in: firmicutes)]PFO03826.1 DNA polymerase IV [Bacillus sp. AFS076308]PGV51209.1 DNA polymerase IV [Bacillus sp. AFS037270]